MSRATKQLWLVHVAGNAALSGLVWVWLGIPDARTWQLAVTAVLGLVILVGALWLHGSTFRYFTAADAPDLGASFRFGLRRLPLFAVWALLFIAILLVLESWTPTGPAGVAMQWLLAWVMVPAALLPLAAALMGMGRRAVNAFRDWRYWAVTAALLVAGVYLPSRLIFWAPKLKSLMLEATSLAARWGIAYLVLVTVWLMLAYVSSGGNPRFRKPIAPSLP